MREGIKSKKNKGGANTVNQVLYRKYRSSSFDDILGQEHIVDNLKQAIANNTTTHAYLFCGGKGTGKTSLARIFARSVNDMIGSDDFLLDIVEIDAASNRGIDEIRSLIDKVNVLPVRLRYKIYIIDEAHMITGVAFNAFLKTLEEPPAHVKFILATTDPQKIPDTILSRVTRYDFMPIKQDLIKNHLQFISKKENILASEEVLDIIATESRGGLRDAISLLDQIPRNIEYGMDLYNKLTNRLSQDKLEEIIDNLLQGKPINIIDGIKYFNHSAIVKQLLRHINYLRSTTDDVKIKISNPDYIRLINSFSQATEVSKSLEDDSFMLPFIAALMINKPIPNREQALLGSISGSDKEIDSIKTTTSTQSNSTIPTKTDLAGYTKGLSLIKQSNNSLYAVLRSSSLSMFKGELKAVCKYRFYKERLEEPKNRKLIEEKMSLATNQNIVLNVILDPSLNILISNNNDGDSSSSLNASTQDDSSGISTLNTNGTIDNDVIKSVEQILGGELMA